MSIPCGGGTQAKGQNPEKCILHFFLFKKAHDSLEVTQDRFPGIRPSFPHLKITQAKGSCSPHPDSRSAPRHEMFTSEKREECVCSVAAHCVMTREWTRACRPGSSSLCHQNQLPGDADALWAFPSPTCELGVTRCPQREQMGQGWHSLYVLGHNSNWSHFSEGRKRTKE